MSYIGQRKRYSGIAEYSVCRRNIDWPRGTPFVLAGTCITLPGVSSLVGLTDPALVVLMNSIVNLPFQRIYFCRNSSCVMLCVYMIDW